LTSRLKRRNQGNQYDDAGVDHQPGNVSDATNIFGSILLAVAQIRAQPYPQAIPVEHAGVEPVTPETPFNAIRNCCLPCGGQAG